MNLAGVRVLFELEERLGTRILETLYLDRQDDNEPQPEAEATGQSRRSDD